VAAAPVASARPDVYVAGERRPKLAEGLVQLEILETADGLYTLSATFGNWGRKDQQLDFLYFDRDLLDFGKDVEIRIGDDKLFVGRIVALEADWPEAGPPTLTMVADDRLQDLRMTRRTRSFADVSDSDVFDTVARDHGLQTDLQVDGPTHAVLAQVNQSDLAFLRERALAAGVELWVEDRTLKARPRPDRGGTAKALKRGTTLKRFTVAADLAGQCTAVVVGGWSVSDAERVEAEVNEDAVRGEVGNDLPGAGVLRDAFGERKERVAHAMPRNTGEARAIATATMRRIARRFVAGRGVAETSADLRVGRTVDLQDLGPLFSGSYALAEVRHRFDGNDGLRTEIVVERAGLGRGP
jgi:phage protein D